MGKGESSGTENLYPVTPALVRLGTHLGLHKKSLALHSGLGADSNCKTTRRGSRHRSVARTETFTAFRPLPDLDTWIAIFLGLQDSAGLNSGRLQGWIFVLPGRRGKPTKSTS